MQFFEYIPIILQLFELFWPFNLFRKIVIETNRYAMERLDAKGTTRGGAKWENLTVVSLKVFLAIHMYMEMKRQPNYKSYWEKEGFIFHFQLFQIS
jgi:RES domain-containing protein